MSLLWPAALLRTAKRLCNALYGLGVICYIYRLLYDGERPAGSSGGTITNGCFPAEATVLHKSPTERETTVNVVPATSCSPKDDLLSAEIWHHAGWGRFISIRWKTNRSCLRLNIKVAILFCKVFALVNALHSATLWLSGLDYSSLGMLLRNECLIHDWKLFFMF